MDRVNGSFTYMKCNNSGKFFLFSIIALLSYLFGLYLFRFTYPEYLVTLIEKVQQAVYYLLCYLLISRCFWTSLIDMEHFPKKGFFLR